MKVPYIDLKRQYNDLKQEIDTALQEIIESCAFVAGKKVEEFEKHFATYCGTKHAIGISSGTSALYVALKALGVGSGDVVVTVPFTFIATVEAITMTGARPVFIDIDPETYNISTDALKKYLEEKCVWNEQERVLYDSSLGLKVKTIMPVHLYGQIADMDEMMNLADKYRISVLEDAAQAHGAVYKGKKAGAIGHIACFSFYPTKNLGAYGQGGAVLTNDDTLAGEIRKFINHGQDDKYRYTFEGWNFKMDGFQAAVLDVKLRHLNAWNQLRRQHARQYCDQLKQYHSIVLPIEKSDREHVYHLFVIRVPDRTLFEAHLHQHSIGFTIAYPIPLHLQKAYVSLHYKKGDFPNTEQVAQGVIGLPIFPELTEDEISYVCKSIAAWVNGSQ